MKRVCPHCQRALSPKWWTRGKAAESARCDACLRLSWRERNNRARGKVETPKPSLPKGWGF